MKILLLTLLTTLSFAKIRIAVVDTTINPIWHKAGLICEDKVYKTSYVSTAYGEDIHADAIIDILKQGIKKPFCIVPVVWYSKNSEKMIAGSSGESFVEALKILRDLHVDYVNLSVNSTPNSISQDEFNYMFDVTRNKKVFVSSGNSNVVMNNNCYMYPMCYTKFMDLTVVGSKVEKYVRGKYVTNKQYHIYSGKFGWQKGTSFSVPRAIVEDVNGR